ncbi:glycosyltransferase family protein [Mesobacillus jeotgali]|uniref:glycosyltransferase family 1 protein n=1 Tax=Mesobacillus jeotgali TaxID=129985 RepID=UPI000C8396FB|nr:glycosyltransferase family 1 protein [Mesobacillus jeotgali]
MKLCFSYSFPKYKPKGDVLQFLILLKAIEQKMASVFSQPKKHFQIDCVLPYDFQNGQDNFLFKHVRFIKSKQLPKTISKLNKKENYDYIFIRCRENSEDVLQVIKENKNLASKLLVLLLHYNLDDSGEMKDIIKVIENSRMVFLQTLPWKERLKAYLLQQGFREDVLDEKLQILPQYIESSQITDPVPYMSNPPQLTMTGVLRSRYGLPVAIQAMKLIRNIHSEVYLHLAYPSVAPDFSEQADLHISAPEVKNHGQMSMWETKELILKAGIGLALIYDDTNNQNPSYSYLTRILEYASLGVPVITTKTIGNIHLLGKDYPLFVEDENDIVQIYQKLTNAEFYQEMSSLIRNIGHRFVSEVAIEDFWLTLQNDLNKNFEGKG